uniref:Intimal thickness related receptor IRP domain-containing protein n=1 Tax=Glossina palpalis gambiensis TaxID=67801 RepID=A0A1B0C3U8_9MUSC
MQFRWFSREEGWSILPPFMSEVIVSYLLVFFGCMGCIKSEYIANDRFALCFHFGRAALLLVHLILLCSAVWDERNSNHFGSVLTRFGLVVGSLASYLMNFIIYYIYPM